MTEANKNQNNSINTAAIDLQVIRNQLVDKGLFFAALVMPLGLAMSFVRNFEHGWHPILLLHVIATGAIFCGVFLRHRLSYQVRTSILLSVFLLIGIAGLVAFGLVGAGLLPLILFSVLTVILIGTREGMIACVLVMGIIALIGWGVVSGAISFSFGIEKYATSVTAWSSIAIVFFLCIALIVFVVGTMQEYLIATYQDFQETNAKHQRLVDNLHGAFLYRHDLEGVFEYVSPSIMRVLGYSQEEFQAHFSKYLTEHPVNQKVVQHTDKSIKGAQQPAYELQIYHKDQSIHWLEVFENPVFNHIGKVIAVEGVAHDITNRKRSEVEKEKLQSQLRHAQKMDAIGQLAAGVAHEFNNIIVGIRGNAESLLHTSISPVPKEFKQPLRDIERSGTRAFELTQQLLTFARKKSPNQTIFDLNQVINENKRIYQRIVGANITLKTQLIAEPALVEADEAEIEQAILNLVMNARDAMVDYGSLVILTRLIELQKKEIPSDCKPGSFVQLSIADDGCGMSAETVERIFEPFFTTKPVGKGTGLGLSTIYSDITKMGGFISVESNLGTGTLVTIHLPESTKGIEKKPVEETQALNNFAGGQETILLCDDEEIVLSSMTHLLESVGYHVLKASSAHEALQKLSEKEEDISLLLTDITMPRMNGFELGKRVHKQYPEMKIIYSSGYTADQNQMKTEDENVAFFDKGDSSVELLKKIRTLLD